MMDVDATVMEEGQSRADDKESYNEDEPSHTGELFIWMMPAPAGSSDLENRR